MSIISGIKMNSSQLYSMVSVLSAKKSLSYSKTNEVVDVGQS